MLTLRLPEGDVIALRARSRRVGEQDRPRVLEIRRHAAVAVLLLACLALVSAPPAVGLLVLFGVLP